MAFRALSRQEADDDAWEIYLYFSWRLQTSETFLENLCPFTDVGFIEVLFTLQTAICSQPSLFVEGSVSVRARFYSALSIVKYRSTSFLVLPGVTMFVPFHLPICLPTYLLLLLPLALQPTVGFGQSNNVLPFFPICHNYLHLLTPSTRRSLSTSSFHLFLGLKWRSFWASYPPPFSLGDLTSLFFALLSILTYFLLYSSLLVLDSSYVSIPHFHIPTYTPICFSTYPTIYSSVKP